MLSELTYTLIMADITSNCNLRCPFCCNDWRSIRGNVNMSQETFSKLIELIPLAQNEGFLFSCLFEPTIHPDFIPFLRQIPALGREKVFFTTNLAKRLPPETFHELSQSNIHHINVSLDSLDPAIYEDLRRGAKFDTFMLNLENLVSVFRKYPKAPRIRFITMAFRQNLNELVDVVSVCHDRFLAEQHEVRAPFNISLSNMDEEWIRKSIISNTEWDELESVFSKLPSYAKLLKPSALDEPKDHQSLNPFADPRIPDIYSVTPKLSIRISSDGTTFLPWNKKKYYIHNINEIENPYMFFKKKLYRIYDVATWTRWAYAFRIYLRTQGAP